MTIWTRTSAGGPKNDDKLEIELRPYTHESGDKITFVRINLGTHEMTYHMYDHQHTFEELVAMFPTAEIVGVPATA